MSYSVEINKSRRALIEIDVSEPSIAFNFKIGKIALFRIRKKTINIISKNMKKILKNHFVGFSGISITLKNEISDLPCEVIITGY